MITWIDCIFLVEKLMPKSMQSMRGRCASGSHQQNGKKTRRKCVSEQIDWVECFAEWRRSIETRCYDETMLLLLSLSNFSCRHVHHGSHSDVKMVSAKSMHRRKFNSFSNSGDRRRLPENFGKSFRIYLRHRYKRRQRDDDMDTVSIVVLALFTDRIKIIPFDMCMRLNRMCTVQQKSVDKSGWSGWISD